MTTRRSSGEGTEIIRGDDGRYHAYLSMGLKAGGKRDRRHLSGESRADVANKLRALPAKRDQGVVPNSGRAPTVASWLDHWLDSITAVRVRPKTLQGYRGMVNYRIAPALGHHRLDRLQPEHVEAFHGSLRAEGLSSSTALQCHRILSRALKVATQRGR
jgi:hypothetical protein